MLTAILFCIGLAAISGVAGYAGKRGRSALVWTLAAVAGSVAVGLAVLYAWQRWAGTDDVLVGGPIVVAAALASPCLCAVALWRLPAAASLRRDSVRAYRIRSA